MTIDKSAIAVTENLTDEQLNSKELTSVLEGFIKSCEKRNTPIPIDLDELFFDEDEGDEGFGYLYPSSFRNYIKGLCSKYRHTLKTLFVCLNNNVKIFPDVMMDKREKSMVITIVNHFEGGKLLLKLPYFDLLYDFLMEYSLLEISCEATYEEITKFLEI